MKIQLENWTITDLKFVVSKKKSGKNSFNLGLAEKYLEDERNKFVIGFSIDINDKEFSLKTKASFVFSMDTEVTEEFKASNFPKINAPAIAFPYLRAFISNFTLQSGLNPLMLPSINFVELRNQNQLKEQK